MKPQQTYDPNVVYFGGGPVPEDAQQCLALRLIEGMGGIDRRTTRVAFAGEHVAIAWTDEATDLDVVVWDIGELIQCYSDQLRTEMGSDEFDEFLKGSDDASDPA